MNNTFNQLASDTVIEKTQKNLEENGFHVFVVENGEAAKKKALSLIPEKAEVMTATSVTLSTIGLSDEINTSGNFDPVMEKLKTMDRKTQNSEMQKIGSAPQYIVGSVHAVTEDGYVLIASNTGSQLPAYVYGSENVIWIVGTQKIVKNIEMGMERIYDYVLPLESERAKKAYGVPGSNVSKLLIYKKEINPNRSVNIIFVKESLGF